MSPPPHSYDDGLDEEAWEDCEDDLYSEDTESISSEPEPARGQPGLAWPDPFDAGSEASSPAGEARGRAPSPGARPGTLGAGPAQEAGAAGPGGSAGPSGGALGSRTDRVALALSGAAGRLPAPAGWGCGSLHAGASPAALADGRCRQRDPSSGRSSEGARERGRKRRGRWEASAAVATAPPAQRTKVRRRQEQAPDFASMSSLEMNDYVRWWKKMHAATWQRGAPAAPRPASRELPAPAAAPAAASAAAATPPPAERPADEEEDAMLQEALRLSLRQGADTGLAPAPGTALEEAAPALGTASAASAARA